MKNSDKTYLDRTIFKIRNNKYFTFIFIVFITVVSLSQVWNIFKPSSESTTRETNNDNSINTFIYPNEKSDSGYKKNEINNSKVKVPILKTKSILLSFQLEKDHLGAKTILINGKETFLESNSTTTNPRLKLDYTTGEYYEIEIITYSKDTCFLKRSFNDFENGSKIHRIIPDC